MIRILEPGDQDALEEFLRPRVDSSLFLLSNSRKAGLVDHGEPFEGTYFAAFEDEIQLDEVEGLFSLKLDEMAVPGIEGLRGRRIERRDLDQVSAWRVAYSLEALNATPAPSRSTVRSSSPATTTSPPSRPTRRWAFVESGIIGSCCCDNHGQTNDSTFDSWSLSSTTLKSRVVPLPWGPQISSLI